MLKLGLRLFFIRHGETNWNLQQRYQGQRDIPLNATGRAQAMRNGRVLKDLLGRDAERFDFVASPLSRARETMQIVRAELGLDPQIHRSDSRLKEIHYGHWEGLLWTEPATSDSEGYALRMANAWEWQPRGGESYRMLSERVSSWLAEVDCDTIAVAHGGVSRVLRGLIGRLRPADVFLLEVPQDKILLAENTEFRWL
jgi:probable phosphoglycerate mutase